jgi:hypothetical protein
MLALNQGQLAYIQVRISPKLLVPASTTYNYTRIQEEIFLRQAVTVDSEMFVGYVKSDEW